MKLDPLQQRNADRGAYGHEVNVYLGVSDRGTSTYITEVTAEATLNARGRSEEDAVLKLADLLEQHARALREAVNLRESNLPRPTRYEDLT